MVAKLTVLAFISFTSGSLTAVSRSESYEGESYIFTTIYSGY